MKHGKFAAVLLFIIVGMRAHASDWSGVRFPRSPTSRGLNSLDASPDPVYQKIFAEVDRDRLITLLKEETGTLPVTVNGAVVSITDRYLPASKANFRAFWLQQFQAMGIPAQEFSYPTAHSVGEKLGHNLEAVLPGKSADSVVIIVHYDSIGRAGQEAANPGVDDDMTGMATLLETARILSEHRDHLQNTVRFVAADYEEHANPGLEGARKYAAYLKDLAQKQNFKIIAAIDNEQSGWNCMAEPDGCTDGARAATFDVFSCSGDIHNYNFAKLGDAFESAANTYSSLKVNRACIGQNSDHYAMWEIGVPAVVFSEHNPFDNDHFDQSGGDVLERIDQDYYFKISQIGVTFAATLAGISP